MLFADANHIRYIGISHSGRDNQRSRNLLDHSSAHRTPHFPNSVLGEEDVAADSLLYRTLHRFDPFSGVTADAGDRDDRRSQLLTVSFHFFSEITCTGLCDVYDAVAGLCQLLQDLSCIHIPGIRGEEFHPQGAKAIYAVVISHNCYLIHTSHAPFRGLLPPGSHWPWPSVGSGHSSAHFLWPAHRPRWDLQ